MYVSLGQVPSIVPPANPTPLNDAALYPANPAPFRVRRPAWPPPAPPANYPGAYSFSQTQAIVPQPAPAGEVLVGYDASGNPIYQSATQPASVTATVSATPGSLSSWLSTGNNGIYAAIAAAVVLLLLMRRR